MLLRLLPALLVASLTCACSEASSGDTRRDFVRTTIAQDNADLFERAPQASAEKLHKMADGVYPYFRGTARVWATDFVVPGPLQHRTAYGTADSARVQLVGDPHIENIGSYAPLAHVDPRSGRLLADFNDFDAATYGPYWFDVRRLSLSFFVLAASARDRGIAFPDEVRDGAMRTVASAYAAEIENMVSGSPLLVLDSSEAQGVIIDDLFRRARRDGLAREELDEYTSVTDGVRQLTIGLVEAPANGYLSDETEAVGRSERRTVERVIQSYRQTLEDTSVCGGSCDDAFRVKGVVRRLGAGVSSYPVLRYYVLVEGPSQSLDDDWLLEVKEARDPPVALTADIVRRPFGDNGERVALSARRSQTTLVNDPLLGWGSDGVMSFRVRERTKFQKNVSVERIGDELRSGDFAHRDILVFAEQAGRLLARTHAQAPGLDGAPALSAIHAALRADADGFAEETVRATLGYGEQLLHDYEMFCEDLQIHGPTLGYVRSPDPT